MVNMDRGTLPVYMSLPISTLLSSGLGGRSPQSLSGGSKKQIICLHRANLHSLSFSVLLLEPIRISRGFRRVFDRSLQIICEGLRNEFPADEFTGWYPKWQQV